MSGPDARCPACGHGFGFLASFKVLNPFKFACPSCGALLTTGRRGRNVLFIGCLIGAGIAALAITMEELGRWGTAQSLTFLAIALPVAAILYQGICWRAARFERFQGDEPIGGRRATRFALGLAIACWLAFFAGWFFPADIATLSKLLGIGLAGMVSVANLLLCGYYYLRGVRSRGLTAATILAATCFAAAAAVVGLLFAQSPVVHRIVL